MSVTTSMDTSSIIEGVGDELVFAVAVFLGMVVPVFVIIYQRKKALQHIHPESEDNVQAVRQEINHQRDSTEETGAPTQPRITENHGQLECPICLDTAAYAVQTNCGHIFCGTCIVTYWTHGSWLGAVRCPVCRQEVTILLTTFTQEEHNSSSEAKGTLVGAINSYNGRFAGDSRPWMDYLRDLPTLLRHAMREFFTVGEFFGEFFNVGGLFWMFRFRVIICFLAGLLYFVSPFDIIPEAVFGVLGYLDDIFILILLAIWVSFIYRQVVLTRHEPGIRVSMSFGP